MTGPQSISPDIEQYRKSKYTEQNPDSKTWTAGIDALRQYPYQDEGWHLSAIEFHHKDEREALALRDTVFASLQPATPTSCPYKGPFGCKCEPGECKYRAGGDAVAGEAKALAELLRAVKSCDSYVNPESGIAAKMAAYEDALRSPDVAAAPQDTYLVGGPDLKAMSGSVESDRVIQLHFSRKATDADRAWLLEAINAKIAADKAGVGEPARAPCNCRYPGSLGGDCDGSCQCPPDDALDHVDTITKFFDDAENADLADETWQLNALPARAALNAILAGKQSGGVAQGWLEPTEAQINSACLSYDHSFGLMEGADRAMVRFDAREWLRAWQKEGFGSDRNEIIERCAQVVDQANREGPYQAIAAASRIRELKGSMVSSTKGK